MSTGNRVTWRRLAAGLCLIGGMMLLAGCEPAQKTDKKVPAKEDKAKDAKAKQTAKDLELPKEPSLEPTKQLELKEPVQVAKEPPKEPMREPELKEPAKEPVKEPVKEPAKEPPAPPAPAKQAEVKEPPKEPGREPGKVLDFGKEPAKEAAKEPAKEPAKQPDLTEPAKEPSKPAAQDQPKPTFDEKYRPRLLAELPDEYNTPDGMRLDKATGDVIVACPNFNQKEFSGKLIKITPDNKWELYFADCPKHPETGYACPMGMDFGPDGNLYYADNQYFYNKDHKSRLIRVNIKDHKPVGADVVVDGFKLSNAVMFKGDDVFVTDTFFDLEKPLSGVYRIPLADMKKGVVKLKPKGEKDPYLLVTSETKPFAARGNDKAGADGMTFDSKGNLYYGHFGDGQLFKITFNADGSLKSHEPVGGPPKLICCDGMFCDLATDKIYIADSARNAIQVFDTKDNSVTTLWENDDTDGTGGLLDQPCEPVIRGNDMIICNFDMPFPGLKNAKYDKPHTISVIKLK